MSEIAEEVADKLREALKLLEPNLDHKSLKLRDAIDLASEDGRAFATAYLEYCGTDSLEELIDDLRSVWKEEGSHK